MCVGGRKLKNIIYVNWFYGISTFVGYSIPNPS